MISSAIASIIVGVMVFVIDKVWAFEEYLERNFCDEFFPFWYLWIDFSFGNDLWIYGIFWSLLYCFAGICYFDCWSFFVWL